METREATKQDAQDMAKLMLEEFSKAPYHENADLDAVLKSLHTYLDNGDAFIATDDGQMEGLVVLKTEQWWEGPVILIEDLAVREGHKKTGVADALLEKVEEYGKKHGAKALSYILHKHHFPFTPCKQRGYHVEEGTVSMRKTLE